MQPSAQGIASLFMGNPGALAARVDQDRKTSPMGIPDDLRQLMALNIVTTENDAAKRQQALAQLQQMAPQGGEPPTVADSVRQQAQQKIQARMAQEMQKQQALQQMMGGLRSAQVPEGVPQPQRQPEPQGIDQAPVEFGMAGGGIVSFQDGGIVERILKKPPRERTPEENAILQKAGVKLERQQVPEGSAISRLNTALEGVGPGLRDYFTEGASQLSEEELASRPAAGGALTERILRSLGAEQVAPKPVAPTVVSQVPAGGPSLPQGIAGSRVYRDAAPSPAAPPKAKPPAQQVARDLPSALPQVQQPAPAPAPIEQEGLTQQGVFNAAAADRALREAEYERRVGKPDRTQLDRLMAEYERQKAAAEGPKAGFDALLEYLGQIAATPRGMSSFEAGAAGARGVRALEKERAATRAALTEKQIGLEREQMKAESDYAKEVFGVGDQAYDRAMKTNMEFFRQAGEDKRTAQRMAHDKTMAEIRLANDKEVAKIKFDYDMRLRKTPPAERPSLEREYVDALEKKGIPRDQAIEIARSGGAGERSATPTDRLRAAQSILNDLDATPEEKTMARSQITSIMGGTTGGLSMTMADVRATAKASGKTEAEVIAAAKAKGYTIK